MKLQYHKLNNWFFLGGILLSALFSVFNLIVLDSWFKSLFWLFFAVSVILCSSFFYHRNVGLIALIFGFFGKPSKYDTKFIDYSKPVVDDVEHLKEITDFGRSSMLFYQLNKREIYQIVKCNNRLILNKCSLDNGIITDFSDVDKLKVGKGDYQIPYSAIKSVTYSYSATNYYLPIISIVTAEKQYRFIGFFEEINADEIKSFFSDIPGIKVKIKAKENSGKQMKQKMEQDKKVFILNVFLLLSSLTFPYAAFLHFFNEHVKGLITVYAFVNTILLVVYLLLPIVDSKHYALSRDEENSIYKEERVYKKKRVTQGVFIAYIFLLTFVFDETYINLWWMIALAAILSIAFIVSYFVANNIKYLSGMDKAGRILSVFLVYVFSSVVIVSCVNNLAVIEQSEQACYITAKSYSYSQKAGPHYTAKIDLDGNEHRLHISRNTYESDDNTVNVKKVKGLLGVEYIVENN